MVIFPNTSVLALKRGVLVCEHRPARPSDTVDICKRFVSLETPSIKSHKTLQGRHPVLVGLVPVAHCRTMHPRRSLTSDTEEATVKEKSLFVH